MTTRPPARSAGDTGHVADHNAIRALVTGAAFMDDAQTFTSANAYAWSTLTVNSATPSVAAGNHFLAANTGATSITNFTSGLDGQPIRIQFSNGNTTLVNGATIKLAGAVNFTGTADDILSLVLQGGVWRETGRSVN